MASVDTIRTNLVPGYSYHPQLAARAAAAGARLRHFLHELAAADVLDAAEARPGRGAAQLFQAALPARGATRRQHALPAEGGGTQIDPATHAAWPLGSLT